MMALAPVIIVTTAVATLAIIPFGPQGAWGGDLGLYGIDVPIGLLYFFAFGSLAFYAFVLGGWASGSKYSFLGRHALGGAADLLRGGDRAVAARRGDDRRARSRWWTSWRRRAPAARASGSSCPSSWASCIFMVAGFAEAGRAPFDLPESDSELVAGYNTEFGGMRFGTFLLAEYIELITISGVATACFLGGWHGPGPEALAPLWVLLKIFALILFFMWIRATLPRLRYDQLMSLGWKVLLPLATLNVLVTAILLVAT